MESPSLPRSGSSLFRASARRVGIGLLFASILAGCAHLPWSGPSGSTCSARWAERPDGGGVYDLAKDAKPTPRGNEGYAAYRQRAERRACTKRWRVLVWIDEEGADAEARAASAIAELEMPFPEAWKSAATTLDADVIAEVHVPDGARRLHVMRAPGTTLGAGVPALARLASPIVELVPAEVTDPAAQLERFVRWAALEYPADEALLVVTSPRPAITAAARALAGAKIGVVLVEPSGAPSVENAVELAPVARFLAGGESAVGLAGLSARAVVPHLNGSGQKASDAPLDAHAVAALVPKLVRESVGEGGSAANDLGAAEGYAASVLDVAAVDATLVPALDRLSRALLAYVTEDELRKIDLAYVLGPNGPALLPGGQRDLGVLLARLDVALDTEEVHTSTPALVEARAAIAAVRTAITPSVVDRRFGSGLDGDTAGITIWAPEDRAGLEAGAAKFAATRLASRLGAQSAASSPKDTLDAWRAWLDAVLP